LSFSPRYDCDIVPECAGVGRYSINASASRRVAASIDGAGAPIVLALRKPQQDASIATGDRYTMPAGPCTLRLAGRSLGSMRTHARLAAKIWMIRYWTSSFLLRDVMGYNERHIPPCGATSGA